MGNIANIIIGALIIGYGGYMLAKSIKKEAKGECVGCSSSSKGCCSKK